MKYPICVQLHTGGQYRVTFPDIPEAATVADSRGEVMPAAAKALESALGLYFDKGLLAPRPSIANPGQPFVELSSWKCRRVMPLVIPGISVSELILAERDGGAPDRPS